MKKFLLIVGLMASPAAAFAQQPQMPDRQRREELEGQIVQRFLDNASIEMKLDANSRTRLEQFLRQTAPARRRLAHQSVQLRGHMLRAVRDDATPDAEFERLISETTRLRDLEEAMWKSDQESLRRILTPRQHARFIVMWMRFNEQIREMANRRGGPPPRLKQ